MVYREDTSLDSPKDWKKVVDEPPKARHKVRELWMEADLMDLAIFMTSTAMLLAMLTLAGVLAWAIISGNLG